MVELPGAKAVNGVVNTSWEGAVRTINTTPRSVEDALTWQLQRIASPAWEGWALKFQRLAFGYPEESGWRRAEDGLNWMRAHGHLSSTEPPRGTLVWFGRPSGITVMCSLGDGRVIGSGVHDRVGITHYSEIHGYKGWSPAIFPFAH